jgi:hypothetical protein
MADRIKALEREVERLRRRLEQRPVITVTSAIVHDYTVKIVGGNTLETGQAGINAYSGNLPSVPSAYDPTVTSSFIDGIGRGTLYIDGVAQDDYVLIVNDDHGSFGNALLVDDVILAGGPVSISVSGGGGATVKCWTAG